MSTINRTGSVNFVEAGIHVWEEGISDARNAGGFEGAQKWERQFKRDVFARIVQQLNRLGWAVGPQHYIRTHNNSRFCQKGDLKGDLNISGRHIEFNMFQSVNCPTRPDHEGRYESDKEGVMPYVLRLEMERTRRRLRDYLCGVMEGYTFKRPRISSPNPDPLAYFNDCWDGESEKRLGVHRFDRGPDGWPSDKELRSWNRNDKDGVPLTHGDVRWCRDQKGRLVRGRVYGGINGMWMMVYGPGEWDYTHKNAGAYFTYRPGETPRKEVNQHQRRKRLEALLGNAVKTKNFERAAVLRDVIWPKSEQLFAVYHEIHGAYHCAGFCGYAKDIVDAGKFTADEVKGRDRAPNKIVALAAA